MAAWASGDYAAVRGLLAESAARLTRAGAEFFVCPYNTAHIALQEPGLDLALPGLHIAEILADEAARQGRLVVGVLGTKWTMEGPVYPRVLSSRGVKTVIPESADRQLVDRIIFDELVNGIVTDAARAEYVRVITELKGQGCDAVALACTEIPPLVTPPVSPLATLDSTRLLARAAFQAATGRQPMPTWRGGPPAR